MSQEVWCVSEYETSKQNPCSLTLCGVLLSPLWSRQGDTVHLNACRWLQDRTDTKRQGGCVTHCGLFGLGWRAQRSGLRWKSHFSQASVLTHSLCMTTQRGKCVTSYKHKLIIIWSKQLMLHNVRIFVRESVYEDLTSLSHAVGTFVLLKGENGGSCHSGQTLLIFCKTKKQWPHGLFKLYQEDFELRQLMHSKCTHSTLIDIHGMNNSI